eukprot:TRINITY_DN671_c0_g1_i1.p1 TRINITY_DN671_c0_g1~~TRINITY_DN671_c0_g1_i1.p1  ORF type:complete len:282 (+),score=56.86 TRINITY_DN671_c0_g1_i1:909-1754(+)
MHSPRSPRPTADIKEALRVMLLIDGCTIHYTAMLELWRKCHGSINVVADEPVRINVTNPAAIVNPGTKEASGSPRDAWEISIRDHIRAHGIDVRVGSLLIKVRFLPANTTSIIQPCDMGWINRLKQAWCRRLDSDIGRTAGGQTVKAMQVFDAIDYMDEVVQAAWMVPPADIVRYWNPLREGVSGRADVARDATERLEERLAILLGHVADPAGDAGGCQGVAAAAAAEAVAAAGGENGETDDQGAGVTPDSGGAGHQGDLDDAEGFLAADAGVDNAECDTD